MDRAEKKELVSTLNATFKDAGSVVVAHYAGMTVAQMTDFRKRMKDAGGAVKVTKNRLTKLALKDTDAAGISDLFNARAGVTYSTGNCNGGNHTSTPVPIFATGPGADQFNGTDLDNTDIGALLFDAVSGD